MGSPLVLKIIAKWILIWLSVVAALNYILVPMGFNYTDYYYVSILYYVFFSGLGIYYYKVKPLKHHIPFTEQLILMSLLTTAILGVAFVMTRAYPITAEKAEKILATRIVFPLFYLTTWATKLADIMFQQVFIIALLKELSETGLKKNQIVVAAGTAFALLHLPLLVLLGWNGLYFIIPSAFAGYIFTYLIINYKRGIFYSYSLHLIFYLVLGMALRYLN